LSCFFPAIGGCCFEPEDVVEPGQEVTPCPDVPHFEHVWGQGQSPLVQPAALLNWWHHPVVFFSGRLL
jgi:hypothetical protein